MKKAYTFMEDKTLSYSGVENLVATAYGYAVSQDLKVLIAETRRIAKLGMSKQNKLNRARDRAIEKNLSIAERKIKLAKYKFNLRNELRKLIHDCQSKLFMERKRWTGTLFSTLAETYATSFESEGTSPVTMAEATLMITTTSPILSNNETGKFRDKYEKIENNFYAITTRVVGISAPLVPSNLDRVSLNRLVNKYFAEITAVPVVLRHKTSKRLWFPVFDFPVNIKLAFFADSAHLGSDSKITQTISEAQTESELENILKYVKGIINPQEVANNAFRKTMRDRMTYLSNVLKEADKTSKTIALKETRIAFTQNPENAELIKQIKENKDRIFEMQCLRKAASVDYEEVTKNFYEKPLLIGKHSNIKSHFDGIIKNAIAEPNDFTREYKLKNVQHDRLQARTFYFMHKEAGKEYKIAKDNLNVLTKRLNFNRKLACGEAVELE
jgi:hypothetical protein